MDVQLNIFDSRSARDHGIAKAVDHADQAVPGWSDQAYALLLRFLGTHVGPFMAEEVRSYAAQIDFPLPPHARAWGGVMIRASKSGIITKAGTGKVRNVKAHCANATIWRQVKKAS
jgi:hypothetical protein